MLTHHGSTLGHIIRRIVLSFNQLGRKLVQSLDLLLLCGQGLLEVFVLLYQSFHRVQRITQIFVS